MHDISFLLMIPAFIVGWIGSEIYRMYKDFKDKRWH